MSHVPPGMKLSGSPEIHALWHTHVLCTEHYMTFMAKVREVNPLVDTLHHSTKGSLDTEEVKATRRDATRQAYRKVFGGECGWFNTRPVSGATDYRAIVGDDGDEQSSFEINVKLLTGVTLTFHIKPTNTVGEIKSNIRKIEGIPIDQQRLIFGGRQLLEDNWTAEEYNIQAQSWIHLVLNAGIFFYIFSLKS